MGMGDAIPTHRWRSDTRAGRTTRSGSTRAVSAEDNLSSATRVADHAETRRDGEFALGEGGKWRGMAGHLAGARGAAAGGDTAARETFGNPSRAHMCALDEIPTPSDHV